MTLTLANTLEIRTLKLMRPVLLLILALGCSADFVTAPEADTSPPAKKERSSSGGSSSEKDAPGGMGGQPSTPDPDVVPEPVPEPEVEEPQGCIPDTCESLGFSCGGPFSDGCGGFLGSCGRCPPGLACAALGTPNVCEPDCGEGCWTGTRCGERTYWYLDADGDGFGDPESVLESCEVYEPPAPSYVDNGDDCYDANPEAFPGQTLWFREDRGDGSYDYDCNGRNDPQYYATCKHNPGKYVWDKEVPDCGQYGDFWHADCWLLQARTMRVKQACR